MKFEKTKEVLNQLVADLNQFSVVIRQTYWYMHGPESLTLHPQIDGYMDQINGQLDIVSEHLIILDGSPFLTLRESAENTKIEDEVGNWSRTIPGRMEKSVAGYHYLTDLYARGIEVSGEEGDDCTQDIFITNKTDIEKNIWMLQAKLDKAPGIDA